MRHAVAPGLAGGSRLVRASAALRPLVPLAALVTPIVTPFVFSLATPRATGAQTASGATTPVTRRLTARDVLGLLGLPDTARVVIIHADDAAITPGTDRVTLRALATRGVSSASVLGVTPFLPSLAAALPRDATLDLGVHLTITSESPLMRWRPAAAPARVRSLLDADGLLRLEPADDAPATEIEAEIAAQVARVRRAGIRPTHLDSHQGSLLFHGPERFAALRRVAKRECLPIPVPQTFFARLPYLADALDDGQLPLADLVSIGPTVAPEEWEAFYVGLFDEMRPGVTLLIVHLDEDTPAERAHFKGHTDYDAAWRARDAALATSGALREMARWHGMRVITWTELARVARICDGRRNP